MNKNMRNILMVGCMLFMISSLVADDTNSVNPEESKDSVEQILNHLESHDPIRAEGLRELQKSDPEAFQDELNQLLLERLSHRRSRRRRPPEPPMHPPSMGDEMGPEERLKMLREMNPEAAERIEQMKEDHPLLFERWKDNYASGETRKEGSGRSHSRRGRHMRRMIQKNPQLAENFEKDNELKQQRDTILRSISATTDPEEKEQLVTELKEVLSKRYDLLVQRKQVFYEEMLKKLENLEKHVQQRKANIDQQRDPEYKQSIIEQRLKKLVEDDSEFQWD